MTIACIIGTDTSIGKTYSCCQIMKYMILRNRTIATLKPIASGIKHCDGQLLNEDVYQLAKFSNYYLNFKQISPFCFKHAIAPHIAASCEKQSLSVDKVTGRLHKIISQTKSANHMLIEGVGGLMVPLNNEELYLDLLIKWNYPIIFVVGIKLGCLNHALLTNMVLKQQNLPVIGWIANQIDPQMSFFQENLNYLINKLDVPMLATIAFQGSLNPTESFKDLFQCP